MGAAWAPIGFFHRLIGSMASSWSSSRFVTQPLIVFFASWPVHGGLRGNDDGAVNEKLWPQLQSFEQRKDGLVVALATCPEIRECPRQLVMAALPPDVNSKNVSQFGRFENCRCGR